MSTNEDFLKSEFIFCLFQVHISPGLVITSHEEKLTHECSYAKCKPIVSLEQLAQKWKFHNRF